MEPAAQATLHEVTPTVELCLSELSYEVERCFAELGSEGEAWDLNPVQFLAMALKRHNPRRGKAALASATAAAKTDVYVKPRRSSVRGGGSAHADDRMMRPAVVEGGFTFAEAALVERRIEEGAVYSGGARLPLIERRGDFVVVTVPQPPPALDPVEANLQALEAARGREAERSFLSAAMAGVEAQLEAMRKKEAEELLASGGPMLALEATAARPTLALTLTLALALALTPSP